MKLSKRMREILLLLYKSGELTRNDIVFHLEKERKEALIRSSFASEYLLTDKYRVSYDRTLKHLKELGLIKGGFPSELLPLSPYQGTLWRGYLYELTTEGKTKAERIRAELLDSIERYSFVLHEQLFS